MTWRVEFAAAGAHQTIGLPESAYLALNKTLALISRTPWELSLLDDPDDPAFRWAPFDNGLGAVFFRLDEPRQLIDRAQDSGLPPT
ncbi:hypothetical protein LO762_00710 [Actinocorallia sp. API 0066]|uniref:hypothetical protein n=1 Tax=Actinocorallia sp. API 0066 TaxID=2896846 RepID=UPI001E58020E|nr:hypothetical protein [Actinocorallia sp. API 0066]MCD0447723.1 hypothetical protein [Actinocorallia sp. API 0066]